MARVMCFSGLKGGIGKTMQAISESYIASNEFNKKVLLIDLDPQSSSSILLGETPNSYDARTPNKDITQLMKDIENEDLSYEEDNLLEESDEEYEWQSVYGIHTLINMVLEGKENEIDKEILDKCIHHPKYYLMQAKRDGTGWAKNDEGKVIYEKNYYSYGFDLMPSTEELSDLQFDISSKLPPKQRGIILEKIIRKIEELYEGDYIFIDCPPSIDYLTINAWFCAKDGICICVSQDKQSLFALSRIKENIRLVARSRKIHKGASILLTIYNKKRITDQYISKTVGHDTRLHVYKTKISESTADARKATLCGLILPQINKKNYEENCKLFEEIEERINKLDEENS